MPKVSAPAAATSRRIRAATTGGGTTPRGPPPLSRDGGSPWSMDRSSSTFMAGRGRLLLRSGPGGEGREGLVPRRGLDAVAVVPHRGQGVVPVAAQGLYATVDRQLPRRCETGALTERQPRLRLEAGGARPEV